MQNKHSGTLTPEELAELSAAIGDISGALNNIKDPFEELTNALQLREVTTDELALVLGITDRRLSQLWQNGDIPEPRRDGRRHLFPLLRSVNDYISFLKSR